MNRKRLTNLLKIAVSLGLIALLLSQIGFQQVIRVFSHANMYYWLLGLGMFLLGVVIKTFRWQILLDSLGINVAITELVQLNFIGFLFNNILPSGIGGDVVKMYELSKDSKKGAESVNSVFVDRVLGLVVAQFMAIIAAVVGHNLISTEILVITIILFLASLLAMWMLTQERLWELILTKVRFLSTWQDGRWAEKIRRLYKAFGEYDRSAILRAMGVSFVFNITLILSNYFVGLAMGVEISLLYFWIFVPITSVITMIPVSLNGLGVREMGYVALFTQAGVPEQVAFSMSLSFYAFTVISGLIGGVLYILRGTRGYLTKEARS
jgi:uncharacterized protein (TIRG00374 family)